MPGMAGTKSVLIDPQPKCGCQTEDFVKRTLVRRRGLVASGLVTAVLLASVGVGVPADSVASAAPKAVAGAGASAPAVLGNVFASVEPQRLMDTRSDPAYHVGDQHQFGQGETQDLVVAGGTSPVPANATAVVVNVTVVDPTASSHVDVWPTGAAQPNVSNVNFTPGETVPNLAEVKIGDGGQISLFNRNGSVDVIVDVVGYYWNDVTPVRFHSLVPSRIADTRSDPAYHIGSQYRLGDSSDQRQLQVTGAGGVPGDATAVVANVTAVSPDSYSHLDLWPDGTSRPNVSNLNYVPGQTVPNQVIAGLSVDGKLDMVNQNGSVDVIVDVVGYFSLDTNADGFTATIPTRLVDTRNDPGYHIGGQYRFGDSSDPRAVTVTGGQVPADAAAIVANITVVDPDSASHLDVWPDGAPHPNVSNLNYVPGQTVANLVTVAVGPNGAIDLRNQNGAVDVIIDIVGYFRPPWQYALALGDSMAAGTGSPGSGYVDDLYQHEATRLPGLQLNNLACWGATTDSVLNGHSPPSGELCASYPQSADTLHPYGTQIGEAEDFLSTHQGLVAYITIDIGANDLLGCVVDPAKLALLPAPGSCVTSAQAIAHTNLTTILDDLKANEGPSPVPIIAMNYYDPVIAPYWMGAPTIGVVANHTAAADSVAASTYANNDAAGVYGTAGASVVDVQTAFGMTNVALTGTDHGIVPYVGNLPQNVSNICTWTHECDGSWDIHPNPTGHQYIADTFRPVVDAAVPSLTAQLVPPPPGAPPWGQRRAPMRQSQDAASLASTRRRISLRLDGLGR